MQLRRPVPTVRVPRMLAVVGTTVLVAALVVASPSSARSGAQNAPHRVLRAGDSLTASIARRCPWVRSDPTTIGEDRRLASEVVASMTLADKLDLLDLSTGDHVENTTTAVPSLCIPALHLQDGPDGLAYADRGVTQLPASIGTAATFDPSMAERYGAVLGSEAAAQGIGAVQGPNLDLVRVPQSGRSFEEFGEDPTLAAEMGDAEIEGIQDQGVMAVAKHFAGYNQETDRLMLNQVVPVRTLEEVDFAPFRSAVSDAGVASVMCAYGELNGVWSCEDPFLFSTLRSWGFDGFIRSDLGAVEDPVAALDAGLNVVKPSASSLLADAVSDGSLSMTAVDTSVVDVLTEMFRFGLIRHPLRGSTDRQVQRRSDTAVALRDAEESVVLLRDTRSVLPLRPGHTGPVAVIGTDATDQAVVAGGGSSAVKAPFLSTPLGAIRHVLGPGAGVVYSPGVAEGGAEPLFSQAMTSANPTPPGPSATEETGTLGVTAPEDVVPPSVATATAAGIGPGWAGINTVFDPPESGTYDLSVSGIGDTYLSLGPTVVLADDGIHVNSTEDVAVELQAGLPVLFNLRWYRVAGFPDPSVTITDDTPAIAAAAAAAASSRVAIVFVGESQTENLDRDSLSLPGDDDALIEAVAAANPRTVVVLNTGGAVLMPWFGSVAAVLEAWYPGEEDGNAITAVLSGKVDPSGRLPVTFPASEAQLPTADPSDFPGVDGTVQFLDGLDIGYRWFLANHLSPRLPFGFGLSYTTFHLGAASMSEGAGSVTVSVPVTDTGPRAGSDVVEVYLAFPPSAGEPPEQLVAFSRVTLAAGETASVTVTVPRAAFVYYDRDRFVTAKGTYELALGTSSESLGHPIALVAP